LYHNVFVIIHTYNARLSSAANLCGTFSMLFSHMVWSSVRKYSCFLSCLMLGWSRERQVQ